MFEEAKLHLDKLQTTTALLTFLSSESPLKSKVDLKKFTGERSLFTRKKSFTAFEEQQLDQGLEDFINDSLSFIENGEQNGIDQLDENAQRNFFIEIPKKNEELLNSQETKETEMPKKKIEKKKKKIKFPKSKTDLECVQKIHQSKLLTVENSQKNSPQKINGFQEKIRKKSMKINNKIKKMKEYWSKTYPFSPSFFKIIKGHKKSKRKLEMTDLSLKLLYQNETLKEFKVGRKNTSFSDTQDLQNFNSVSNQVQIDFQIN